MIVTQGDIVYHKLTGQPLIVIESIENFELDNSETLECRYKDNKGVYQSEDFYGAELTEKMPVKYSSGAGGCGGNCRCESTNGGGIA